MYIAGYEIVIGVWDIISLLIPIGLVFVFCDFKRRHKTRMERLEMLYGNDENLDVNSSQLTDKSMPKDALLDKIVDGQM